MLAKTTNTPVLFTEAEIPVEVDGPTLLPDAPAIAQLKQAPLMAFKPTGEIVTLAEVVTAPPAEVQAAPAVAPMAAPVQMLPGTASKLPLIGLLGLLAVAGALAIRTRFGHLA